MGCYCFIRTKRQCEKPKKQDKANIVPTPYFLSAFIWELESRILLSMIKVSDVKIIKNKFIFIFSMGLLTSLCGYSQSYIIPIQTKDNSTWKPVIVDVYQNEKSQYKSNKRNNTSVVTFKPVSATLTDSKGSFTSTDFNCGNLYLVDNGNSIDITIAGDKFLLYPIGYGNDTYQFIASQLNQSIKLVAYRSSRTNEIYLVVSTTIVNQQKIVINFKP